MSSRSVVGVLLMLICSTATAQQDGKSVIIIPRDEGSPGILLDGKRLPPGSDTVIVEPGVHVIERVSPNPYSWTLHRVLDTLVIGEGEIAQAPQVVRSVAPPGAGNQTAEAVPPAIRSIRASGHDRTLTIVSAVAMIGSSVAAAFLKIEADRALDEYRRTNSNAALDKVRRYDRYSAVAAATMVVSFSGFALLLTSR